MKKILNKIKHFLLFCDINELVDTGEWEVYYYSPFMFPTTRNYYKCKVCNRITKMNKWDFSEYKMYKQFIDLQLDTANRLKKLGKIDKAIEVLKIRF